MRIARTHLGAAAIGLGLCRDREAVPMLLERLAETSEDQGPAYVALALGMIGDERSIQPLLDLIGKKSLSTAARAFAVVALGQVGDVDPRPWSTPISVDLNYTATTGTLIAGDGTGLLEIL